MFLYIFLDITRSCHRCRLEAARPHTRCSGRFSRRFRAAWFQGTILKALGFKEYLIIFPVQDNVEGVGHSHLPVGHRLLDF